MASNQRIGDFEFDEFKFTKQQLRDIVAWYTQGRRQPGLTLAEIMAGLEVEQGQGMQASSVQRRQVAFGSNKIKSQAGRSFLRLLWQAMQDSILRLLLLTAVVSIIIQAVLSREVSTSWMQSISIIVAIAVISLVTAFNNYQIEQQFLKLGQIVDDRKLVCCTRNGKTEIVHQDEIVVGEVVRLRAGNLIPADSLVLNCTSLLVDQSGLVSDLSICHKLSYDQTILAVAQGEQQIPSCVLLRGSSVVQGQCVALVVAVGESTFCQGSVVDSPSDANLTPLQSRLANLATDIGRVGLVSALLVFISLMVRFVIVKVRQGRFDAQFDSILIANHVKVSLTLIIVTVPEGLPMSVLLSLAYSVKEMLIDNNLVRKLDSCETMALVDEICVNLSGILTDQSKMVVTYIWNEKAFESNIFFDLNQFSPLFNARFNLSAALNNCAELDPSRIGTPVEIALLEFLKKMEIDYSQLRRHNTVVRREMFSNQSFRMATQVATKEGSRIWLVKGAPQTLLPKCTKLHYASDDSVEKFTPQLKRVVGNQINQLCEIGLKVICMAYYELDSKEKCQTLEDKGLTFLAVIGLRHVVRAELIKVLEQVKRANIRVRLVTGDDLVAAKAVAQELGIYDSGNLAIKGSEFFQSIGGLACKNCQLQECTCQNKMLVIGKKQVFKRLAQKLDIIARARPQDKHALVSGLRQLGKCVAVTGKCPADVKVLQAADVSFAMDIEDSQLVRQMASIYLLEDNFKSISRAVLWGRNIYESVQRFIQFQLTGNLVLVVTTLVCSCLLQQPPLTAVQLLWANLVMDSLASLALATDKPDQSLMEQQKSLKESIITINMVKQVLAVSVYQITIILLFVFLGQTFLPQESSPTEDQYYFDAYSKFLLSRNASLDQSGWAGRFYNNVAGSGTVCSGRYFTLDMQVDYYHKFLATGYYSRHFTYVFNVFILMQLFNYFNCRRTDNQFNIFRGILGNKLFWLIIGIVATFQVVCVSAFKQFFNVYSSLGLTPKQWLVCLGFAPGVLLTSFLVKVASRVKRLCLVDNSPKQTKEVEETIKMLRERNSSK